MGVSDAGFFGGHPLRTQMVKRGVAGLVSDGVVRDVGGVLGTHFADLVQRFAAPPSSGRSYLRRLGEPIGCGGVRYFQTTSSSPTRTEPC